MILSDVDIEELNNLYQIIHPYNEKQLTPNGYDLSVDKIQIDGKKIDVNSDGFYSIPPNTHFLAGTKEKTTFPDGYCGTLFLSDKYARQGIMATFGKMDSGFSGVVTLSLFNSSTNYILIPKNATICQVVFETMMSPPAKTYVERSGNYQNTTGIKI